MSKLKPSNNLISMLLFVAISLVALFAAWGRLAIPDGASDITLQSTGYILIYLAVSLYYFLMAFFLR